MITVAHIWPLFLLLAVPLFVWVRRRTATGLSDRHLALSTAVRSAVIIMLALALMQPIWHRPARLMSVVFALDVSGSVAPTFIDSAIDWIAETSAAGAPAHARYIAFGGSPQAVGSAQGIRDLSVSRGGAGGSIDQDATDVEAAVAYALRNFDPRYLRRLVLITDANETQGDVLRLVGRANEEGVRVFTLPAGVRASGDSWVEAIELADEVRQGEPVAARVHAYARAETSGTLELRSDGEVLEAREVTLQPGPSVVPFEVRLPRTGTAVLEAELRTESDSFAGNDLYRRSLWVSGRPRVLYVEGRRGSVRFLRDALRAEDIDVVVGEATDLPEDPAALEGFDAVLLSDVPIEGLTEPRMQALETYVRDLGGGLIFAGGESTYGEEAYAETPVEEILPVWFRVHEQRKDLALVIVLDKSFSMVGPKIELSKEAAKAALALLEDTHRFGLLTFDHSPYWTVPIQLAENKTRINEYISSIIASAHTNIYPALEKAFEGLEEIEAEVEHIILLSDGKTYPDDYETLVTRMAEAEITLSTVAVGEEADRELLENIARWGNGRSYYIREAARVPQIFIEETQIASQSTLVEEEIRPILRTSVEAFAGIDFDTAPPLKGFVSTQAKDTAEVLLATESEAPLLARWNYGLGKTAMFTSDVKNRWAVDWLEWDGYGKFWAQLVRETMRHLDREQIDFRVGRQGREAVVALDAVGEDGRYLNDLQPEVEVIAPDGRSTLLPLRQVGSGSYETKLALQPDASAPYRFELAGAGLAPQSRTLFYADPDEYRLYPANATLLRALSDLTGGKYRPEPDEIFADYGDRTSMPTPLWPYLAALALLLYLLDIAIRRAPWFYRRFASTATAAGARTSAS
jgi:uncharacterized membrane protein